VNHFAAYRSCALSLEELVETAAVLLRRLAVRPEDGRVAAEPDVRGVRYYQTLGIVDKPQRYDGRRAVYGYRHLLQLLAVKRLQQEGHALHQVQQALAGRSTDSLEAGLVSLLQQRDAGGAKADRVLTYGVAQPRHIAASASRPLSAPPPDAAAAEGQSPGAGSPPQRLIAVRVATGVTLTVDPLLVDEPYAIVELVAEAIANRAKEH
jgi:DNA-binding transcriptional MerR regulator